MYQMSSNIICKQAVKTTMTTVQELYLDISRETSYKKIYAKQYDQDSRYLCLKIRDKGYPIEIGSDCVIRLNFRRDGENPLYAYGELDEDGCVHILLSPEMLQVAGEATCNIAIFDGDEKLSTLNFTLVVEESPDGGEDYTPDIAVYSYQEANSAELDLLKIIEELQERLDVVEHRLERLEANR